MNYNTNADWNNPKDTTVFKMNYENKVRFYQLTE